MILTTIESVAVPVMISDSYTGNCFETKYCFQGIKKDKKALSIKKYIYILTVRDKSKKQIKCRGNDTFIFITKFKLILHFICAIYILFK